MAELAFDTNIAGKANTDDLPQRNEDTLRVLIVDDSEGSAKTLGWAMELFGHEPLLASTGPEAIAAAKKFLPHIVFLDIGLPNMNGYEVCQIMRQDPAFEKTIFIAQTGWSEPQHRRRSEEVGFSHHLVKPIDIKALGQLIDLMKPNLTGK